MNDSESKRTGFLKIIVGLITISLTSLATCADDAIRFLARNTTDDILGTTVRNTDDILGLTVRNTTDDILRLTVRNTTDDILGPIVRNTTDDILGTTVRNTDDILGTTVRNTTDDIFKNNRLFDYITVQRKVIYQLADDTFVFKYGTKFIITRDKNIIKQLLQQRPSFTPSSNTPFLENIDEVKRLRLTKVGEEAAKEAVKEAFGKKLTKDSLNELAKLEAKRAICQEIAKHGKTVVVSSETIDSIAVVAATTAIIVTE